MIRMSFIVPKSWKLETLPRPLDERVVLNDVPSRIVAAHYFSGNCTDEYVDKKEALLREALPLVENGKTYKAKDGAKRELARYNDPFTPWFLRTNELWIEVDEEENRD